MGGKTRKEKWTKITEPDYQIEKDPSGGAQNGRRKQVVRLQKKTHPEGRINEGRKSLRQGGHAFGEDRLSGRRGMEKE